MVHILDYVKRHGCPMNYDGWRGEIFGKLKNKENVKFTNKQKDKLNFFIGCKISEKDVIVQIFTVNYQYLAILQRFLQKSRPRLKLIYEIDYIDNDQEITEEVNINIDWEGSSKTSLLDYSLGILKKIAHRWFIGYPYICGKISPYFSVSGYTEIKKICYHIQISSILFNE